MANGPNRGFTSFNQSGTFNTVTGVGGINPGTTFPAGPGFVNPGTTTPQGPQFTPGESGPSGFGLASMGVSVLQFGFEFAGMLDALKQVKSQANFNRRVAEANAGNNISNLRLFEKRFLSTQKAQGASTGFSTDSSLVNRLQTMRDADIKVIRRNETLATQLQVIDANERANRKAIKAKIVSSGFNLIGGLG